MGFDGAASGKVILLGEHAVVHGVPALAASIGLGARGSARTAAAVPRLRVRDSSGDWLVESESELARAYCILNETIGVSADAEASIEIPTRAGLGSSACLGVALARALLRLRAAAFDDADVSAAATAWERVFHGNPSGVDVAVATHGGCISFSRTTGVSSLALATPIPLCVGDTGLRSSTRAMVEHVADELARQRDGGVSILEGIRGCVSRARGALLVGNWSEVGQAMGDNHRFLRALGLSNPETETLCSEAVGAGALAAKITGAGGGGCIIALAPGAQQQVLTAWRAKGFGGFSVDAGV